MSSVASSIAVMAASRKGILDVSFRRTGDAGGLLRRHCRSCTRDYGEHRHGHLTLCSCQLPSSATFLRLGGLRNADHQHHNGVPENVKKSAENGDAGRGIGTQRPQRSRSKQVPKSGTTPYTTHFLFVPKSTVDIPGFGRRVRSRQPDRPRNGRRADVPQDASQVRRGRR